MTRHPDPTHLPRLRVNLSVVCGHYADTNRRHTPSRRRDAMYTAVRDIPILVAEVERLWRFACDRQRRYLHLRAVALASITADDAGSPDPLFDLREELHSRREARSARLRTRVHVGRPVDGQHAPGTEVGDGLVQRAGG
jgi:hypothetical protein